MVPREHNSHEKSITTIIMLLEIKKHFTKSPRRFDRGLLGNIISMLWLAHRSMPAFAGHSAWHLVG
jgi:hypothetical protein